MDVLSAFVLGNRQETHVQLPHAWFDLAATFNGSYLNSSVSAVIRTISCSLVSVETQALAGQGTKAGSGLLVCR